MYAIRNSRMFLPVAHARTCGYIMLVGNNTYRPCESCFRSCCQSNTTYTTLMIKHFGS